MNFREATPAKVSDDFEEEAGQTFTTQLLCREGLKSKIFTFRLSRRSCWVVRVGVTSGLPSGRGATFTIERGATFTTQLLGRESGVTPGSPPARPPPTGVMAQRASCEVRIPTCEDRNRTVLSG